MSNTANTAAQVAESILQTRADQMVQREVMCCLSALVSMTADFAGMVIERRDQPATGLAYQAQELCMPISDYEEAAIQAGWIIRKGTCGVADDFHNARLCEAVSLAEDAVAKASPADACGWEDLCNEFNIEPYEREVYEHWAVSTWLAEKLEAKGERVDMDFANLNVWARTTTGQAISMDAVIREIVSELHTA